MRNSKDGGRVDITLVPKATLEAEIARRNAELFMEAFKEAGPQLVSISLWPAHGPDIKTFIQISPDGTWKLA